MWKNPAPARSCAMSSGIRRAASIWSRSAMMRGRNARATSSRLKKTADCGDEGGFCDARWSKLTAAAGGCLPQLQPAPDHRRQVNRRNCAAPAPKKVAYPAVFTACFRIADHCEACSAWWSRTIPTARARSSGEYGGTRFVMAPSSQELEPPGNSTIQLPILMPATMRSGHQPRLCSMSRLVNLCPAQEVVQPTDAVPPITIAFHHHSMLAIIAGMAVLFCQ
jgi:hypothetical protein